MWCSRLALVLAMTALPTLAKPNSGSQTQETSPPKQTIPPEQDETMPAPSHPEVSTDQNSAMQEQGFAGKITKSKDGMVLKDPTNHTTYRLDDAEKARRFLGKNVTVTGTLDQASKTIHVSNIEPSPTF
jgi:hypothetical protein